jgi:hypothetical protein
MSTNYVYRETLQLMKIATIKRIRTRKTGNKLGKSNHQLLQKLRCNYVYRETLQLMNIASIKRIRTENWKQIRQVKSSTSSGTRSPPSDQESKVKMQL